MNITEKRINQFSIVYIVNPKFYVNKALEDQVGKFLK